MKSTIGVVWLRLFTSEIRLLALSLAFIHHPLMADALLSIVLERLASVVEQQIRDELTLVLGVEAEIQSLTDTLRSVRDVLEDAERRQVKEKSVQGWLERLKDMAYQMDDVVDEWSTAILQLQIEGAENHVYEEGKLLHSLPLLLSQASCFSS